MKVKIVRTVEAPWGSTHYDPQSSGILWYMKLRFFVRPEGNYTERDFAWYLWDEDKQVWGACDDPYLSDEAAIDFAEDGNRWIWEGGS